MNQKAIDLKSMREIIGILMESSNYFKLNLKERYELLKYFIFNNLIHVARSE